MFTEEEFNKIQAMIDLFKLYFPLKINNKPLETLIIQGGMGVDISTDRLAAAVSMTGSIGTISTTMTAYKNRYSEFDLMGSNNITFLNNLVKANDYEEHYKLGERIGVDGMVSGAGISKEITRRIKNQRKHLNDRFHYWTIPIISSMSQLPGRLKRNCGIIILENTGAGGHNGEGKELEETLDEIYCLKHPISKEGNIIIGAGEFGNPLNFIRGINVGFDAIQIGSLFLGATETNIDDRYRLLIINSQAGDAGKVASPAYFPATGLLHEGIAKKSLNGIDSEKLPCGAIKGEGCLELCEGVQLSAKACGYTHKIGDYCIWQALRALNPDNNSHYDPLYFSTLRPEKMPLKRWAQGRASIPAKEIIRRLLSESFDIILDGSYQKKGFSGKITAVHQSILEESYRAHKNKPAYSAKILSEIE
jgi:nitronate monooxygenase